MFAHVSVAMQSSHVLCGSVPLELLPEGISVGAIDLLTKLLCKDPAARPKLRDVMVSCTVLMLFRSAC